MKNEENRAVPPAHAKQNESRPTRYSLYDRLRDHLSLNVINAVIVASALAIIALLIVGILTASP